MHPILTRSPRRCAESYQDLSLSAIKSIMSPPQIKSNTNSSQDLIPEEFLTSANPKRLSNSKMILEKNGRKVFKDGKPVLDCAHSTYGMFYRCANHSVDNHLHCIRCGIELYNIQLREDFSMAKIYDARISHDKLIDTSNYYCNK